MIEVFIDGQDVKALLEKKNQDRAAQEVKIRDLRKVVDQRNKFLQEADARYVEQTRKLQELTDRNHVLEQDIDSKLESVLWKAPKVSHSSEECNMLKAQLKLAQEVNLRLNKSLSKIKDEIVTAKDTLNKEREQARETMAGLNSLISLVKKDFREAKRELNLVLRDLLDLETQYPPKLPTDDMLKAGLEAYKKSSLFAGPELVVELYQAMLDAWEQEQ